MHKGENVGPRSLYNEVPKLEGGGAVAVPGKIKLTILGRAEGLRLLAPQLLSIVNAYFLQPLKRSVLPGS